MTAAFTLSPLFHSPSLKISSAFLRRMLLSCLIYEATTRSCPVGPQPLSLLFTSPLAATGLPRTHLRGYHSLTSSHTAVTPLKALLTASARNDVSANDLQTIWNHIIARFSAPKPFRYTSLQKEGGGGYPPAPISSISSQIPNSQQPIHSRKTSPCPTFVIVLNAAGM